MLDSDFEELKNRFESVTAAILAKLPTNAEWRAFNNHFLDVFLSDKVERLNTWYGCPNPLAKRKITIHRGAFKPFLRLMRSNCLTPLKKEWFVLFFSEIIEHFGAVENRVRERRSRPPIDWEAQCKIATTLLATRLRGARHFQYWKKKTMYSYYRNIPYGPLQFLFFKDDKKNAKSPFVPLATTFGRESTVNLEMAEVLFVSLKEAENFFFETRTV
jgi:hypothetical protein